MTYIAGVDIGNSTTEVCIGEVGGAQVHFLSSASCKTTGTKGTIANVHGIRAALKEAMGKIGMETEAQISHQVETKAEISQQAEMTVAIHQRVEILQQITNKHIIYNRYFKEGLL